MFDYELTFWDKVRKPYWFITRSIDSIIYYIKEKLRKIFRGYSGGEWYDFYSCHARYCLPRLHHLRENIHGHPMIFSEWGYEGCDDEYGGMGMLRKDYDKAIKNGEMLGGGIDAWKEILDKMILAFTYIIKENSGGHTKLEKKLIKAMINLYGDEWEEIEKNKNDSRYHLFINPNCKKDDDHYSCHVSVDDDIEKIKKEYDEKGWDYKGIKGHTYYHSEEIAKNMLKKVDEGMVLFSKYYQNLWD